MSHFFQMYFKCLLKVMFTESLIPWVSVYTVVVGLWAISFSNFQTKNSQKLEVGQGVIYQFSGLCGLKTIVLKS